LEGRGFAVRFAAGARVKSVFAATRPLSAVGDVEELYPGDTVIGCKTTLAFHCF
jgi:hypothetical protein